MLHDGQERSASSPIFLYASIRTRAVGRLVSQSMVSTDGTSKAETLFIVYTSLCVCVGILVSVSGSSG